MEIARGINEITKIKIVGNAVKENHLSKARQNEPLATTGQR